MSAVSDDIDAPPDARDLYATLGLAPAATGAEVRAAYWRLARAYQSSAVGDPQAPDALDALNEAAEVLGTPDLRRHYDAALRADAAGASADESRHAVGAVRGRAMFRRGCVCALLFVAAGLALSPASDSARASSASGIRGAHVTTAPIVFLGDSVTLGAGASSPDAAFAGVLEGRLEHAGYATGSDDFDAVISALGGQAVDLRFAQDIGRKPRSLVVVEVGAHSVVEDRDLSSRDYAAGYGLMLDCLQGTGAAIVATTVAWLGWPPSDPFYEKAAERSTIIKQEAASRGIPVADIWSALKDRPELLSTDGFHPDDAGHDLIANLLWMRIAPLLGRPRGVFRERCDYDRVLAARAAASPRSAAAR